jgi:hypothetical protein
MNNKDTISINDFKSLLDRRFLRYGEVLLGKGSASILGQIAISNLIQNELNKLIKDFQLFEGDFWGYGINFIKFNDVEYNNFDTEEIFYFDELNKHHKYYMFNLILYSIIDFNFQFNIFQINLLKGKFISKNLEKIPIDKSLESKIEIISPKIFISIESKQTLKFQLDPELSLVLESVNKYAKNIIDVINTKKSQQEIIGLISQNYTDDIIKVLSKNNIIEFINILKSIFSSIPYQLFDKSEKYFHIIVHVIMIMINRRTGSEICSSVGRTDTIIELEKCIYILEFKVSSAKDAIDQIHEKRYYEPYKYHRKEIFLLGISFSIKDKNINDWKLEKLANQYLTKSHTQ